MFHYKEIAEAERALISLLDLFEQFAYKFYNGLLNHIRSQYGIPEKNFIQCQKDRSGNNPDVAQCVYFEQNIARLKIGIRLNDTMEFSYISFALERTSRNKYEVEISFEFNFIKHFKDTDAKRAMLEIKDGGPIDFNTIDDTIQEAFSQSLARFKKQFDFTAAEKDSTNTGKRKNQGLNL